MTINLDRDLPQMAPSSRWREWMQRVEAVLFASNQPVTRDMISRVVGASCAIDLLIEDIANELQTRPYELVQSGGGWILRSRSAYAEVIRAARGEGENRRISQNEALVLTAIAYMQPVTRNEVSKLLGREVGRETIGRLSRDGFLGRGPRSPEPGSPYTYVTTQEFLLFFGLSSLRDLPDLEALEDAGFLASTPNTALDLPIARDPDEM